MSSNLAKYEVLIKQYLRSILDISGYYAHCTFTTAGPTNSFKSNKLSLDGKMVKGSKNLSFYR